MDMATEFRLRRRVVGLLIIACTIAGAFAATDNMPQATTLDKLIMGSAQTILAVALVSVTGAMLYIGRQLLGLYRERVLALEAAVVERSNHAAQIAVNVASHSKSIETLAQASDRMAASVDRMVAHCVERGH